MFNRRSSVSLITALLILGLLLVAIAGILLGLYYLPVKVAQDFGPPSPILSTSQTLIYSVKLYLNKAKLLEPTVVGGELSLFRVELGESVNSIVHRLDEEGFITDADALRLYLVYSGLDTSVQAGEYLIDPGMNAIEIGHFLQDATPAEVIFCILPGWRIEEIAAVLPTSGLEIDPQKFIQLAQQPGSFVLPQGWPQLKSLEGFLYPDEYSVERDISELDFGLLFTRRFEEQVSPELRLAFENQGLDLLEAVTLASIVQREAVIIEEQPVIASVFLNRLAASMKLDSDPTVQYAVGYESLVQTWWTNPISLNDLQTDSPYNTYIYPGLPPGPICNPGLSALNAVAYPAQTSYYYFRSSCDESGYHEFSVTYEEHLQNECP